MESLPEQVSPPDPSIAEQQFASFVIDGAVVVREIETSPPRSAVPTIDSRIRGIGNLEPIRVPVRRGASRRRII